MASICISVASPLARNLLFWHPPLVAPAAIPWCPGFCSWSSCLHADLWRYVFFFRRVVCRVWCPLCRFIRVLVDVLVPPWRGTPAVCIANRVSILYTYGCAIGVRRLGFSFSGHHEGSHAALMLPQSVHACWRTVRTFTLFLFEFQTQPLQSYPARSQSCVFCFGFRGYKGVLSVGGVLVLSQDFGYPPIFDPCDHRGEVGIWNTIIDL